MTINLETAEKAAKWGSAGFGLITALISIVSMVAEAKNGRSVKEESDK